VTIVELYKISPLDAVTFYASKVARFTPARITVAAYWTTTFGAPDESSTETIFVDSVVVGTVDNYTDAGSLANCLAAEHTFFWDNTNQELYVNCTIDENPLLDIFSQGKAYGWADDDVAYIDDVEYLPLVLSVPSVAQQADLFNYEMFSFVSGQVQLVNADGILDSLKDANIYGSYVRIYYLDTSGQKLVYSRGELVIQSTLYVEDWEMKLGVLTISVQDVRKFFSTRCPTEEFLVADYADLDTSLAGNVIPLAYGPVRWAKATCTNGVTTSGNVNYRVAQSLTAIGNIYVVDGVSRVLVTPVSTDLATGSFVLAEADARDTSGTPLQALVESMTGIAVTYASDVIKDLNDRYVSIPYLAAHYDTAEWEAEEVALAEIGVLFDQADDLYSHIKKIQSGANVGFRYEVTAEGKRTIRVDDFNRAVARHVNNVEIANIDEIPVETNTENLAGIVIVKYDKNLAGESYRYVKDDSNEASVLAAYKQDPTVSVNTLLVAESDASDRATGIIAHQGSVRPIVSCDILGREFLATRIYDILELELTPDFANFDDLSIDGREYFGFWKASVISIDPDFRGKTNRVQAVLTEQIT